MDDPAPKRCSHGVSRRRREGIFLWFISPHLRRGNMRTIIAATIALLTVTAAHAEGCTRNHELFRIVPEFRAVVLDGGDIKRVMYVDMKDERLSTWKPGHNITFCPDENK